MTWARKVKSARWTARAGWLIVAAAAVWTLATAIGVIR